MRGKFYLLLMMFVLSYSASYAQSKTITGTVIDELGEPLSGVTVTVKGAGVATTTNDKGAYTINVPGNSAILVYSFIGRTPSETTVGNRDKIDVVLNQEASSLDDVVVIGYGTMKRKDLTGAVASLSGNEVTKSPVGSVVEAMTGKIAGVQISATEGSPDAELKIRVRGGGSITGDNTPLFIVDGFPVQSISDIAPSEIESIDVLKDASSTAIYGSRGANGVIIITTRNGKTGKTSVTYNVYGGPKEIAKTLNVLTPADYIRWQYELALLSGTNGLNNYEKYFGNYQDIDLYYDVPANDWQRLVFGRTGSTFNHNLSINGGSDKTKYLVSYNHIKDNAIMQLSDYKRDNLSLKLSHKANKKITLDFSFRYANTAVNGGGMNEQNEVSSADSRLKYAMIYPPFPVSGLTNSDETDDNFNLYNPLVSLTDNDRYQKRVVYNLNAGLTWNFIPGLQFKTVVGMDDLRNNDNRFYGTTTYYVKNVPGEGLKDLPAIIFSERSRESYRNTNTLSYDFRDLVSKDHSLNLLVGEEYIITQDGVMSNTVHGFPKSFTFADATKLSPQGTASSVDNFMSPDDKLLSFFGRSNYSYKDRYLLSVTFRADGSSKFSEGHQWGYFPSAAAAWRISSEPFMQQAASSWLSDLKLRASYGTAGNNNIPPGQITQTFGVSTTAWVNGFNSFWAASKTMANPNLKWETTVTRNIGLDFSTFNSKLSGTVDVYSNSTKDLLILFPVPGTGYDNQYRNMGETRNKGFEVTLNWDAVREKNFGLSVGANIGFNKNEIVSLGQMENFGQGSGWASTEIGNDYWIATGSSVGVMYGYQSAGRYEVSDFEGYNAATGKWTLKSGAPDASPVIGTIRPGSMKLVDVTGDKIVDASDRVVIGNANPKHTGGFNINGRAFSFDLSAIFNWSYGNDIYNANKIEYTSTSKYTSRNMIDIMAEGKRWTNMLPDGTLTNDPQQLSDLNANTTMWSPYMSRYVFSDWAVEDGSFLRLNTLTLGYTVPSSVLNKVKVQNLRVYVSGYNVFVLTNYTGFDPEVSTRRKTQLTPGVDYSAYPKSRLIVFGLNLNF